VVERQLPKLYVVGSIPIARSTRSLLASFRSSTLVAASGDAALQRSIHFCFDSHGAAIMVRHGSESTLNFLERRTLGRNAGVAK
jgi:hypothetical protein